MAMCFICGRIGHTKAKCMFKRIEGEGIKDKDESGEEGENKIQNIYDMEGVVQASKRVGLDFKYSNNNGEKEKSNLIVKKGKEKIVEDLRRKRK